MHKAISGVFILFMLFLFCSGSSAQAAEMKIGIANLQKVVTESNANKEAEKKLTETFSEERNQLEKLGKDIEKLTDEMKNQSSALSVEAKQTKRTQLVQMMRDHNDRTRAFNSKVRDAETVIRNEILAAVVIASKEYAEKNHFDIILDSAQAGVLYSSDSLDVTKELLNELNRVWEAAATRSKNK